MFQLFPLKLSCLQFHQTSQTLQNYNAVNLKTLDTVQFDHKYNRPSIYPQLNCSISRSLQSLQVNTCKQFSKYPQHLHCKSLCCISQSPFSAAFVSPGSYLGIFRSNPKFTSYRVFQSLITSVESSLIVGDQCWWLLWASLVHELTFSRTIIQAYIYRYVYLQKRTCYQRNYKHGKFWLPTNIYPHKKK